MSTANTALTGLNQCFTPLVSIDHYKCFDQSVVNLFWLFIGLVLSQSQEISEEF
jgi:hypothetical protein